MSLETDLQEGIRQHAASRELWQQQSTLHTTARDKMVADVNTAIGNMSVLGNGIGSLAMNIFSGRIVKSGTYLNKSGDFNKIEIANEGPSFLHLDTGNKKAITDIMNIFMIRGYDYGSNTTHFERSSSYLYPGTSGSTVHSQNNTTGNLLPFQYIGSNGNLYLRLKLLSTYFNVIAIDAMSATSPDPRACGFVGGRVTPLTTEFI